MASITPSDMLAMWEKLSAKDKEFFKESVLAVDNGSVNFQAEPKKDSRIEYKSESPFMCLPPEYGNTVQLINPRMSSIEQVESVVEMITRIKEERLPRGLVLNKEMAEGLASRPTSAELLPPGFEKTTDVLGKGNSAGEIIVVKDRKTKKHMALKTISVAQFNKDEIYMWIQLGEENLAPELYHFELKENKVFFTMQIMDGMSLQEVIDEKMHKIEPDLARKFSLCILHDLLEIQDKMRTSNFSHNDIHGGNIQLEESMKVKIFDFGRARQLLKEDDKKLLVKNDVVNLIRVFCCLYSGFDFNSSYDALKVLEARKLDEINDFMIRISKDQRKEMYMIMTELFDTVREWRTQGYGDTRQVASHVRSLIDEDMMEIKKRLAVFIFPETYQHGVTQSDSEICCESELTDNSDPAWDDDNMPEYEEAVTLESLEYLGVTLKSYS